MKFLATKVEQILRADEVSGSRLWLLNRMLAFMVPFNAPHAVSITSIGEAGVRVRLPYRRKNLNHVRGLHACALATAAEYSSGMYLLHRLTFSRYRLLMRTIEVSYAKQGREDAIAVCEPQASWFADHVLSQLENSPEATVHMEIPVVTTGGLEICRAKVEWHLKEWAATKTFPA